MKKILFLLGLVSIGTASENAFESLRMQKIKLFNNNINPIFLDVISEYVVLEQKSVVNPSSGYLFKIDGENFSMLRVDNDNQSSLSGVSQFKTLKIDPNQVYELELSDLHYFKGISTSSGFEWNAYQETINVFLYGDHIKEVEQKYVVGNIRSNLHLYKKYFMKDGNISDKDILLDFISQKSGVTSEKRSEEIVITLTSYPARFETTWLAIESLLRQTEKPDRINLNLFEGEFPGKVLPWFMRKQMNRGLEINWCPENFKVYLKVIPTVQRFSDAVVVATDDDVIYPEERLHNLMDGHREHPDCVIAQEVREIQNLGGHIYPVCEWNFTGWNGYVDERKLGPSNLLIPEGVTGILFPKNSFDPIVNNYSLFRDLTPTEDDLWLYAGCILNEKKILKIKSNILPFSHVIFDAHNMDCALSKTNTVNGYQVSTQCFFNLFYRLNLGPILGMKSFSKTSSEVRSLNADVLSYGEFITPREKRSPISLLAGWSWTENWIGHRGGVWTDSEKSTFAITVPALGFSKMHMKARFLKHRDHPLINFRIKRDGFEIFSGEFESEWFEFSLVDCFKTRQQQYELIVINPLKASNVGFKDDRNLGILIHKINIESMINVSFDGNSIHQEEQTEPLLDSTFIDPDSKLIRDGALNITFDYANTLGITDLQLQNIFSNIINKSFEIAKTSQCVKQSIPFIHHRAWHTSETNPKEIPLQILQRYINSLNEMHRTRPEWTHVFWCNKKELIPSTLRIITSNCPWVNIREVKELNLFVGKEAYEKLMDDCRYTNANDIFRLSAIYALGGVYFDVGFEVVQDISELLFKYTAFFYMYPSGGIDHNFMGMEAFSKFSEAYLRRILNPESVSRSLRNKYSEVSHFQHHLFCGSCGLFMDLLDRITPDDRIILIPEENPYYRRYNMASWVKGNNFGNKPVEETKINFFQL